MNYDYYKMMNNPEYQKPKETIFDSCENGFLKGNMSKPLYDPFRGYKEGLLKATDENLYRAYNFAAIDLGLYLDTHPNCEEALKHFFEANEKKELYKKFLKEKGYPLTTSCVEPSMTWNWLQSFTRGERD